MPKYRNNNSDVVTIGSVRIEPREYVETLEWIQSLPSGVEKTSDSPSYNPVILSTYITSSGVVVIPTTSGPYRVKIWSESGQASLAFNVPGMSPALVLTEGVLWDRTFLKRILNHIYVTFVGGSGKVWVQVEEA